MTPKASTSSKFSPTQNVRKYEAPRIKEPYEDAVRPTQIAYNHLTTIASYAHGKVARALALTSLKAFDVGCWALGVPSQPALKPRKSAVAILNAGEGAGRILSLRFAEAGYTVFALIHSSLDPSDDGSIANLIYQWQHRRAATLARRDKQRLKDPETWFPDLGTVIPLPFLPLSVTSRQKISNSIKAYCDGHRISLQAFILTPVFASCQAKGDFTSEPLPETPILLASFGDPLESPHSSPKSDVESEPPQADTEQGVAPQGHLPQHPRPKYEGSYVPLTSVNQFVWERAIQRELTEQLLSAQAFAGLLMAENASISGRTVPTNSPKPIHFRRSASEVRQGLDVDTDEDLEDLDTGLGWQELVLSGLKRKAREYVYGRTEKKRGGRIIWVTGCGEATFQSALGSSAVTQAAREAAAQSLGWELSDAGVQVSIVQTGPLSQRSAVLSNLEVLEQGQDPRDTLSPQSHPVILTKLSHQASLSRLLARVSALWALDDESFVWIVRQAVEVRHPQARYSLGLDVTMQQLLRFIPNSVWELSTWVVYERLQGKRLETWLTEPSQRRNNYALSNPLASFAAKGLGWAAHMVKRKEEPLYAW